jgi:iron(III) transport system permease protein
MRTRIATLTLALLVVTTAACSDDDTVTLTVYSGRSQDLVEPLFDQFTEQTGIQLEVRYAGSTDLAATLREEGANSPADVFFAQDPASLGAVAEAGLFSPLSDDVLSQVPEKFSDDEGRWIGTSGRARVVVFDSTRVSADDLPDDVFGFTDPEWQGRVGIAPGNGSFLAFVAAMIIMEGEETTREWLEGLAANDPGRYEKNTPIVAAVNGGEIETGLVNHYYLLRLQAEEGDTAAANHYLASGGPGSLVMPAGAGILATTDQPNASEQFVRFLVSSEAGPRPVGARRGTRPRHRPRRRGRPAVTLAPGGAPPTEVAPAPVRRRRTKRRGHPLLWLAAIAALAPVVIPFLFLLWRAAGGGSTAIDTVFSARTLELVWSTGALVVAVSALAAVIGVGTAWLTERTDLPGRRVWRVVVALPLVLPSYVIALAVISALGPRGLISDALGFAMPTVRGFWGALWALTVATYPFVYLIVGAALRRIDPTVEEAARGLGSSPWSVFTRIVLPQLRQAIGAGVLLSALYTLSDFGAVSLVGYDSFTRVVYAQYAGRLDRTPAIVLAAVLVLLALAVLLVESNLRRGRGFVPRQATRTQQPMQLSRGQRGLATTLLSVLAGFALVLPVGTLIAWLARDPLPRGIPWGSLAGSATASLLAALVAVALAIPVAILVVRHSSTRTAWVERVAYLSYSIPHITVGLAMVFVASRWLGPLYQSLLVLVAVYAGVFFAQALGAVRSALSQVSPSMEEAARGLGRTRTQAIWTVVVPLMRRGIAAGGLLVFLTTMKELPITLLLRPTGLDTLAVDVWSALLAVSAIPTFVLATRTR